MRAEFETLEPINVHGEVAVQAAGSGVQGWERVLTPAALEFVGRLHVGLNPARLDLLLRRDLRQADLDRGVKLDFLPAAREIRETQWRVAPAPPDLEDRRVEITGPVERKMMINALNSGAKVFMADFEDSLSPTWDDVIAGQVNLQDAVRRRLEYTSPEGKRYELNERLATLVVRPRGWHLHEKHVIVDEQPISAALFDFGLYVFHNARELLDRGSGPYLYLPKLESHAEAQLWNNAFVQAQEMLGIPRGTIRATVLIETIPAAFEMDEILYVLREHAAGLNAGRWDYLFSIIKKHRASGLVLPDRAQLTMAVPFMRAYTELLVATCHRRGAHAIGGMAAYIPSRRDAEVNEVALAKVREDKERESAAGFDGTWVAHPDLVPVAGEVFDRHLGDRQHAKHRLRDDVRVTADDLLDFRIEGGRITEQGVRNDVSVSIQYLDAWFQGVGAVAINNLMEDTATAEIARAQLWQWLHHGATLDDGRPLTHDLYRDVRDQEIAALGGPQQGRIAEASVLLDELVLDHLFTEFLTLPAYERLP